MAYAFFFNKITQAQAAVIGADLLKILGVLNSAPFLTGSEE
jgi:hypothetical protein